MKREGEKHTHKHTPKKHGLNEFRNSLQHRRANFGEIFTANAWPEVSLTEKIIFWILDVSKNKVILLLCRTYNQILMGKTRQVPEGKIHKLFNEVVSV